MRETIAFIGGGNMAMSLIGGLLGAGHPADRVLVIDPDANKRSTMEQQYNVPTLAAADDTLLTADVWVLAVKPQILPDVARGLAGQLDGHNPLIISIAAGIRSEALAGWLGGDVPIVRCMPNTPSLIGAGATALFARTDVDTGQRSIADTLLSGAGQTVWVDDEATLDAVTATSGSGPAYFFAFMEAMEQAATDMGLSTETARALVVQTALGAARMVDESGEDPGTLRERVTSPGGTTEQALIRLGEGDLNQLINNAMRAAAQRSAELADEFANT